jgi:hypothetical protein
MKVSSGSQDVDVEMRDIDETEVYLPSKPMEKDHVLMPDLSAYDMLHSMSVQWPFLSFDIIRDSLGEERRNVFPLWIADEVSADDVFGGRDAS